MAKKKIVKMETIKIRKLFIALIVGLFMCGCVSKGSENENDAHFEIINNTGECIDSLYISLGRPDGPINKYISLQNGERASYMVDMSISEGDGSFKIGYTKCDQPDSTEVFYYFGYFTNGSVDEEVMKIELEDTVIHIN